MRCLLDPRLLAAALDVALDELLGVLLEDLVDLVEQVVQVLLDLLALLAQLGAACAAVLSLGGLAGPRLLLLLLRHERSPPGAPRRGPSAGPRPWAARSPAGLGIAPAGPRRTSGRSRRTRRRGLGQSPRWRRSWPAAASCC